MLLHQIRTAVDARIDNTVYWTDAKKTAFANDCLRSIVARFNIKFKGYTIIYTIDGQQRYVPPVDFISDELLFTNTDSLNRKIVFVDSPDELYTKHAEVETLEGAPVYALYWPVDDKPALWLQPVPDKQYKLEWWYFREAPLLVNDDDQPIIDSFLHNYIVDYIEWKIKVADGDLDELTFAGLWKTALAEMAAAKTIQVSHTIDFKPGTVRKRFPRDAASGEIFVLADPTGAIIWGDS